MVYLNRSEQKTGNSNTFKLAGNIQKKKNWNEVINE